MRRKLRDQVFRANPESMDPTSHVDQDGQSLALWHAVTLNNIKLWPIVLPTIEGVQRSPETPSVAREAVWGFPPQGLVVRSYLGI